MRREKLAYILEHSPYKVGDVVAIHGATHHIRITDVLAERLQDISDEDCLREGVQPVWDTTTEPHRVRSYYFDGADYVYKTPSEAFAALADKVSGRGTWDSNPFVRVYSFELVD